MKSKTKMACAHYRATKRARDRAALETWMAQVLGVLAPHGVTAVRIKDITIGKHSPGARWYGMRQAAQ